jgi:multiple sugar transport system substrate-binding protein
MRRSGLRVMTLAAIPVLVLSACNSTVPSPSPTQVPATATPAPSASASPSAAAEAVTIRWFVGLDLGTQSAQIDAEKAFVANYNSANKDGITIKLEVVPTVAAADVLKNEMAAGNAPDIVGPVGVGGLNGFEGLFLDLTSAFKNANIDLTAYDPGLVEFLQLGDQGQVGLPYMIFPGYIWYNKDIFTKAGLPSLPTKVGDRYQGQTWDWYEMAKIAAQLTVDKSGKKATDAGFDPKSIVRYGLDFQWNDLRRMGSCFGSGSFVGAGGKAQVPAAWADAATWYYTGIWGKTPFIPSGLAESSALLGQGNAQSSGNVAMNVAWASSIPSIASDTKSSKVKAWDIGVMPSWKGNTTSPMYADTFTITKASKDPDAAFKAMVAIMADQSLLKSYGGEPAKTVDQQAYFDSFDSTLASIYPGIKVSWSVLGEMQKHPAVPSFETDMPNFAQAQADYMALLARLRSTPGLDVIAELTKLQAKVQQDFDAVQPLLSQ